MKARVLTDIIMLYTLATILVTFVWHKIILPTTTMLAALGMIMPALLILLLINTGLDSKTHASISFLKGLLAIAGIETIVLAFYTASINNVFMEINTAVLTALTLATYTRIRAAPLLSTKIKVVQK